MSDVSDMNSAQGSGLADALAALSTAVESRLIEVIEAHRRDWQDLGRAGAHMLDTAALALRGGKRMRAVLGGVGMSLPQGSPDPAARLAGPHSAHLGAALELYQASALMHDDVIDAALTRRGMPATHERHAADHRAQGWLGEADAFGRNAAVLGGDLLLSAAGAEMGAAVGASVEAGGTYRQALAARDAFDAMTTEVAVGQFLDVRSQVLPLPDPRADPVAAGRDMRARALEVVRRKSARYSVMHPLLIGALLGGVERGSALYGALHAFGESTGVAFQLRDDVLGVFGDPRVTGKPAGDDLREGKRTVLVALAWQRTDGAGRRLLTEVLSHPEASPERVGQVATLIESCGARAAHEAEITAHQELGLRALDEASGLLDKASDRDLRELAEMLTARRA